MQEQRNKKQTKNVVTAVGNDTEYHKQTKNFEETLKTRKQFRQN